MYRVLLAEDNPILRKQYAQMEEFKNNNFKVIKEVSDGKKALDELEKNNFDLLVTDIHMPNMNGIELLHEIRKRKIKVCVIFISAYENFEYAREGILYGIDDYIIKPPDSHKLSNALQRVKKRLDRKNLGKIISREVLNVIDFLKLNITDNPFMKNICIYISQSEYCNVTMEETAEQFGFSKDYFGKLFIKNADITFSRFCTLVKMEYAKTLLSENKYKSYQISELLGYSGSDYFARIFKEVTGKSPSEYKDGK